MKWKELHTRGLIDRPMRGEGDWFHSFLIGVPCPKCQAHFEKFVKKNPPDFGSRTAFFRWSVEAHNEVNEATGKKCVTLDQAYALHKFESDG